MAVRTSPIRSSFGGHIAGNGMIQSFYEESESYFDRKAGFVRFPNDGQVKKDYASLCGPVIISNLYETKQEA